MRIIPRKGKPNRAKGHYYFGDYGTTPASISIASINDESEQIPDRQHYHKKGYEFYVTLQGKGTLEVNGQATTLEENNTVMVEPGEKHSVKGVLETPFLVVIFNTVNEKEDKVEAE